MGMFNNLFYTGIGFCIGVYMAQNYELPSASDMVWKYYKQASDWEKTHKKDD